MNQLTCFEIPNRDRAVVACRKNPISSRNERHCVYRAIVVREASELARLWARDVPGHHGVIERAGQDVARGDVDPHSLDRPTMADQITGGRAARILGGSSALGPIGARLGPWNRRPLQALSHYRRCGRRKRNRSRSRHQHSQSGCQPSVPGEYSPARTSVRGSRLPRAADRCLDCTSSPSPDHPSHGRGLTPLAAAQCRRFPAWAAHLSAPPPPTGCDAAWPTQRRPAPTP